MRIHKNASRKTREHTKEILGVLYLGLAVFLILCLFSYNALDPSLTTLSRGGRVSNLGGMIGAYLADALFASLGYAAYLIPLALGFISFTFIAGQLPEGRSSLGWRRISSVLVLVLSSALLIQLKWGEVSLGGRESPAGGLFGWWLGHELVRFLGLTGTTLLAGWAILLSLLALIRISLLQFFSLVRGILLFLFQKGKNLTVAAATIAWARGRKNLSHLLVSLRGWWKKRKSPAIRRPVALPLAVSQRPPPTAVSPQPVVLGVSEPRILPRVDLKEDRKKGQLELISPKVSDFQLPQLSFLDSESQERVVIDEETLKLNSKLLEKKLQDYGVEGRITEIHPGPIITMYEFEPAAGVKVNKIVNLEDDLALTMGGKSVRIIAPLPGKAAVGIEIPNNTRETVWLKDVIGHTKFQKSESRLTLALGKDTEGIPFVADLGRMPHLLVAGATGSGKSVSVNSMILSLLYKATPRDVRLIMVDLKMLELSIYEAIPHLLLPVVTSPRKASLALRWSVAEMERRYEVLAQKGARNIAGFNKLVSDDEKLPYIVIVIDELADLIMTAAKDVETSVTRLAQMARAAGIHLILATQRPSVDVLTGLIKANFPARISFKVTSKHDSRTIIDTVGSEHLLGSGDMLFMSGGTSKLIRVHGAYVSETEILRVVDHWKKQGKPEYLDESVLKPLEPEEERKGFDEDFSDELYDQAVSIVAETRQASISMIQRRLRIGYNRAARMIERMEKEGVVGPADGAKPRDVYVNSLSEG